MQLQPTVRERLDALTSLRFFASLLVVVSHLGGQMGVPSEAWGWLNAQLGVSLFFLLSGFILSYNYPSLENRTSRANFFVARFARIWPVHAACIALGYLLIGSPARLGSFDTLPVGLLNLGLLHAWVPDWRYFFSYNGVSWSISVEAFFYASFPLIIASFGRTWHWKACIVLLLPAFLVALCIVYNLPGFGATGPTTTALLYINPAARIFEFFVGVGLSALWRSRPQAPLFLRSFVAASLFEITVLAMIGFYGFSQRPIVFFVGEHVSWKLAEWVQYTVFWIPISATIVFLLAGGRGVVTGIMKFRPLMYLGEISFSLYMVHQILIHFYKYNEGLFSGIPSSFHLWLYLLSAMLVSIAMFHCVEKPARSRIIAAWRSVAFINVTGRLRPA